MTEQKDRKRVATEDIQKYDLLKGHHQFLRESGSEEESSEERRKKLDNRQKKGEELAKKYYQKLYKQYALVNLQRFQKGQIGCRWRTQKQVLLGKGQGTCGQVNCKTPSQNVYEMNFGYVEQGQKKNALVKVSVCKQCAFKLNYKKVLKKISSVL